MFEDSLVESSGRIKTRRGVTTFLSFALQMLLLGVMVLIPLIYTEALPKAQLMTFLSAPPPPPPPPPPPSAAPPPVVPVVHRVSMEDMMRAPTVIPKTIAKVKDEPEPAPTSVGVVGGVPGGVPGGQMGGVLGGVLSAAAPPPP